MDKYIAIILMAFALIGCRSSEIATKTVSNTDTDMELYVSTNTDSLKTLSSVVISGDGVTENKRTIHRVITYDTERGDNAIAKIEEDIEEDIVSGYSGQYSSVSSSDHIHSADTIYSRTNVTAVTTDEKSDIRKRDRSGLYTSILLCIIVCIGYYALKYYVK